jgi:hypothetical protein
MPVPVISLNEPIHLTTKKFEINDLSLYIKGPSAKIGALNSLTALEKTYYGNNKIIICQNCGNKNERTFKFCNMCGTRLQASCQNCGNINSSDSACCSNCGVVVR